MHRSTNTGWFSARIFVGLAVVATLAPSAWGYVNGGDYRNSLDSWAKMLKSEGWGVIVAGPMSKEGAVPRMAFVPPENPEHERYVNQLVGRAIQSLPKNEAAQISPETKREIASLIKEAIQQALKDKREVSQKGQTGSLQYQVGVYAFESYWETNYRGKPEIHARQSGLAPVVALKVVAEKDQPERQP